MGGVTTSKYEVVDMGMESLGTIGINGNVTPIRSVAEINPDAVAKTLIINALGHLGGFSKLYLESFSQTTNNIQLVDVNAEYTCEGNAVIAGTNYSQISSL